MQVDIVTFLLVEGLIGTGVIIYRLMKKIEKQEQIIVNQSELIEAVSIVIENTNEELKEIDKKGAFESDDEVGFFFKNLKLIQSELNKFIVRR